MSELEYTEHGWRMTTDTKRHHRARTWNYKGCGIYHFTLVVAERYPLFGELVGDSPETAHINLNEFGQLVLLLLRDEPRFYGQKGYSFEILATQVMPDHIHMAFRVMEPLPKSIGTVIRGFKSACTALYKKLEAANGRNYATKREIDFPFSRIFTRIGSIWQHDAAYFYDRIIHGGDQIDNLIHYIKDNPRRLWLKRANSDLFRLHQHTPIAGYPCVTLGNMFLYESPFKAPLQCSRTLSQTEIDKKKQECLRLAEQGVVWVSPAISEGEKQICRAIREAGYPLIILLNDGFPSPDSPHYKYYKPSGIYFEACAAGKLLLIEPYPKLFEDKEIATEVYRKDPRCTPNNKRYRFLALNALIHHMCNQ